MAHLILSNLTASVTELKAHPMATVNSAAGEAIAILNHNVPAFYCVPAKMYEAMMDVLEDIELAKIVRERSGEETIEVNFEDL